MNQGSRRRATTPRRAYFPVLVAAVGLLAGALGACQDPYIKGNAGLLLKISLDPSRTGDATAITNLRFYVGVQVPDNPHLWVLDPDLSHIEQNVEGRDLINNPYSMLIISDKDVYAETVRVIVVGQRPGSGKRAFFGFLSDPDYQTFENRTVVERHIVLQPGGPGTLKVDFFDDAPCIYAHRDGVIHYLFGTVDDRDCDGYQSYDKDASDFDCNDYARWIHPGAWEYPDCEGVDEDCDPSTTADGNVDHDGDGYTACEGDCWEGDGGAAFHPGAEEICGDGVDNNCDGICDEDCGSPWEPGTTSCREYRPVPPSGDPVEPATP